MNTRRYASDGEVTVQADLSNWLVARFPWSTPPDSGFLPGATLGKCEERLIPLLRACLGNIMRFPVT